MHSRNQLGMWKIQRLQGTMTTFAAIITTLVLWFLVGTCRSKHLGHDRHLITNVNHDGRHLNMISGAKVNASSVNAYMNLKIPLLGSVKPRQGIKCPDNIPSNDLSWEPCNSCKKNTCYAHIDLLKTWIEAKDYCKNISTGLKSHSGRKWKTGLVAAYKYDFLVALAQAYGTDNNFTKPHKIFLTPDGKPTRDSGPWIGGNDIKEEGTWEWVGRKDLEFSKDEIPNGDDFADNHGPHNKENCMEIFNDQGDVNDMECDYWRLTFICEAVLLKQKPWHSAFPIRK